jgi:hypothetical protein
MSKMGIQDQSDLPFRLNPVAPYLYRVRFCVGNEVFSPNSRKAFIYGAFVSDPGQQR